MNYENVFIKQAVIKYPIICGPMYPCSNPELIAAVSNAGGIGIVQPLSLVFTHKYDFREGLRFIKSMTKKPFGMNIITEKSSQVYEKRMKKWLDISLEEGVRFFVSSLGDPKWIVDHVLPFGGIIYHDVTERKWAQKALDGGVHGLICVNSSAGGHAGKFEAQELFKELSTYRVPLICAGGVSDRKSFRDALRYGYSGVQMGTRFIATHECRVHQDYKNAIIQAKPEDIVLTEKISGVPVSVINTEYIHKTGTRAHGILRYMLTHQKLKHWARLYYTLQSVWKLKRASLEGSRYQNYWQAGKSVAGCDSILHVEEIMKSLVF
jgi:nitronate monooxygenase